MNSSIDSVVGSCVSFHDENTDTKSEQEVNDISQHYKPMVEDISDAEE